MSKISVFWQYFLPHHLLSRFNGVWANSRCVWLKNLIIQWFISHYAVDMSLAQESDPLKYPTFNSFFTRTLKPDLRPISQGSDVIVSPVDGAVSQAGKIQDDQIFQAKGFYFTLSELLGGNEELANRFKNGLFATLYLSPKDYHRVHLPLAGRLKKMIYVPGRLFSVNRASVSQIPRLFSRNERVIALFETALGDMAVILVGAMIVASIKTVWAGLVAPSRGKREIKSWDYSKESLIFKKGDELGCFELGSTVIVLFPDKGIELDKAIEVEGGVVMGQLLAKTRSQAAEL